MTEIFYFVFIFFFFFWFPLTVLSHFVLNKLYQEIFSTGIIFSSRSDVWFKCSLNFCEQCVLKTTLTIWTKQDTVRSAWTLKPLKGDVNNTEHLITINCSVGKPLILPFMYTTHPDTVAGVQVPPYGNSTLWWQWCTIGTTCLATPYKLFRNGSKNVTKSLGLQQWGLFVTK